MRKNRVSELSENYLSTRHAPVDKPGPDKHSLGIHRGNSHIRQRIEPGNLPTLSQ